MCKPAGTSETAEYGSSLVYSLVGNLAYSLVWNLVYCLVYLVYLVYCLVYLGVLPLGTPPLPYCTLPATAAVHGVAR